MKDKIGAVAQAFSPEAKLKRRIRAHFTKLGFTGADDGTLVLPGDGKHDVRQLQVVLARGLARFEALFTPPRPPSAFPRQGC